MTLLKCAECPKGNGTIEKDGKLYECMCATLRRVGSTMPSYIRKAMVTPYHISLPLIRNPRNHYYILCSWSDLKAVIKLVMLLNSNRVVKITSDREIRDVYVGSKSRRAIGDNSDGEVLNSLEDLVDHPFLVILRLNELFYKNKAAAGALEEAMSIRLHKDKPLWVINNRENPFGKGSIAWSPSVEDLISGFEYLEIPRINRNTDESDEPSSFEDGQKTIATIQAPSLNRQKRPSLSRSEPILHTVSIDEEDPISQDVDDTPTPRKDRLSIDTSGVNDEVEPSPLARYGSGLSNKKNRSKRNG